MRFLHSKEGVQAVPLQKFHLQQHACISKRHRNLGSVQKLCRARRCESLGGANRALVCEVCEATRANLTSRCSRLTRPVPHDSSAFSRAQTRGFLTSSLLPRLSALEFCQNFHIAVKTRRTARQVFTALIVSFWNGMFRHALEVGIGRTIDAAGVGKGFREIGLREGKELFLVE